MMVLVPVPGTSPDHESQIDDWLAAAAELLFWLDDWQTVVLSETTAKNPNVTFFEENQQIVEQIVG